MRKVSTLVGLTLFALAATASAQENTAASGLASVAPTAEPARRIEVGASLLSMGFGEFSSSVGGMDTRSDMAGAFGFGLSASYRLIPGLSLGFAPQMLFSLKPKGDGITPTQSMTEYDLMARIAYAYPLAEAVAVYAELLPGYSIIVPSAGDSVKGFVLGFGAGLAIDVSSRLFATLGAGYQLGFQRRSGEGIESGEAKTRFLRVAMSLGFRL